MSTCPRCNYAVGDNISECPRCNTRVGYPNVVAARAEAADLMKRADDARGRAVTRGADAAVGALEAALSTSMAVVNVDVELLCRLLTDEKLLYGPYGKLIEAGVRLPAAPANDRQRTAVEGILFGSWGGEIIYAALALDGRGLGTYGPASMELVPLAVDHRASLLTENSYTFVEKHFHGLKSQLPPGHRSEWSTRGALGVAKLADHVDSTTAPSDHAGLVLRSDGVDRGKDEFIEVHIYGAFNRAAVHRITVLTLPSDRAERQRLKNAGKVAKNMAIRWSEP